MPYLINSVSKLYFYMDDFYCVFSWCVHLLFALNKVCSLCELCIHWRIHGEWGIGQSPMPPLAKIGKHCSPCVSVSSSGQQKFGPLYEILKTSQFGLHCSGVSNRSAITWRARMGGRLWQYSGFLNNIILSNQRANWPGDWPNSVSPIVSV